MHPVYGRTTVSLPELGKSETACEADNVLVQVGSAVESMTYRQCAAQTRLSNVQCLCAIELPFTARALKSRGAVNVVAVDGPHGLTRDLAESSQEFSQINRTQQSNRQPGYCQKEKRSVLR